MPNTAITETRTIPLGDPLKTLSLGSRWLSEGDSRLDATAYAAGSFAALDAIERCGLLSSPFNICVGGIQHPTQNQPRSNFKRIWVDDIVHGFPFVSGRELLHFRLPQERFVSRSVPKMAELRVPTNSVLLSRSGTIGIPVFVGRRLAEYSVTDDALRICPGQVPMGYIYAYLASAPGYALLTKGAYGATVDHLEPKHLAPLPVPIADESVQNAIHKKIVRAYSLRDEANDLLDEADALLHRALGIPQFTEKDVKYLGTREQPKAFAISSRELGTRFDATRHVPVATSAVAKLSRGRYPLVPLSELAGDIYVAPRFARIYVDKEHGTPLLQGSHVPMMRIHDLKYISNTQTERMERWIIHRGQVLVTCSGTLGRVALASSAQDGWAASQHILRLTARPGESHPGFLAAFLMTAYGQHQLLSKSYGGVVDELTDDDTAAVIFPKVPFSAQEEIGTHVEEAYELRDQANRLEDEAILDFERLLAN
jgi:type I restriction enzyme S subunit